VRSRAYLRALQGVGVMATSSLPRGPASAHSQLELKGLPSPLGDAYHSRIQTVSTGKICGVIRAAERSATNVPATNRKGPRLPFGPVRRRSAGGKTQAQSTRRPPVYHTHSALTSKQS